MPLIPTIFADELDKFGNPDSPLFEGGPESEAEAVVLHAAAFSTYMRGLLTVPPPAPPIHDAAQAAMQAALVGQSLPAPAAVPVLNAAYLTYASTVVAGLAAQGWVVATPPTPPGPLTAPIPPGFGSLAYALVVDTWLRLVTGSIPPVPPAPWA